MLINNEKTTINVNEPSKGYWLVDETTEEGQILVRKIMDNYPYFDFVLDDEGNLIDIIPTERPEPEPMTPIPTLEERLKMAEDTILFLLMNGVM